MTASSEFAAGKISEREMEKLIRQDSLMTHVKQFAKRINLSGSLEERESFSYLERRMRAFGYSTRLLSHDAFISLPVSSRLVVDGNEIVSITHSMAASTPAAGLCAELIYVGKGDETAFAVANARGKIALIEGIAMENVSVAARQAGAIGEIHISPTEHRYEMCVSPVWGSPSQHTRANLPTTAGCTISRADGARLRERLQSGETLTASLWTTVDTGWRKTPLLVAELAPPALGEAEDAPFVLFSGHHDTWHYGVMDNGGANASMLEAAQILAISADGWRRGLRICFWSGHSHGRYSGSAWYADEYCAELDRRCAVHVNLDSTGGKGATVLTRSGVMDELKSAAAETIAFVAGQAHEDRRQARSADHSFWGVGVPSMFGSISHQPSGKQEGPVRLGWWWHTPFDTEDNIDPDHLVRDTRVVLHLLVRLLTAPVLPLDYGAYAASLLAELGGIARSVVDRLDLSRLLTLADQIGRQAALLKQRSVAELTEARQVDAALMRVSRALVPINYTAGDRFVHDPALPNEPWPSLRGLRELATLALDSPETLFYVTHARQTRNRVAHALQQALDALNDAVRHTGVGTATPGREP